MNEPTTEELAKALKVEAAKFIKEGVLYHIERLIDKASTRLLTLAAENKRLREAHRWRPIAEAPKDGTGFEYFQRISTTFWWIGVGLYENGKCMHFDAHGDGYEINPSHFRPLMDESDHPDLSPAPTEGGGV